MLLGAYTKSEVRLEIKRQIAIEKLRVVPIYVRA